MNILVVNCGSSSVKTEVIDSSNGKRLLVMNIERLLDSPTISFGNKKEIPCEKGHKAALEQAFPLLQKELDGVKIHAVGHRVVHGGNKIDEATLVDGTLEQLIEDLSDLAPLHNPANLIGIKKAKAFFEGIPHVAVFDTAFHATLPRRAKTYALPKEIMEKHDIQRYGFHGTSHEYVAQKAAEHLGENIKNLRIITCHLGNGCSMAAIEYGRSVETSMGLTPL
ncbi:MAG: acetate/propionate family kinase, partial [Saprospiraceae bacterium]